MKTDKVLASWYLILVLACVTAIVLTSAGCSMFTMEQKKDAQELVMVYLETYGQDKVIEYIDNLVAEGRMGYKTAEDIKAMIPELLERIRQAKEGNAVNE